MLKQAEAIKQGIEMQLQQFERLIKQLPKPLQRELRTIMEQAKQGNIDATAIQRIAKQHSISIDAEIAATEAKMGNATETFNKVADELGSNE